MAKSAALLKRASAVFPGRKHTRLPLQGAWAQDARLPTFLVRGEGSHVVDVDGRRFIDYHCGFGASVLGYAHPAVEAAAAAASSAAGGATLTGRPQPPWSRAPNPVQLNGGASASPTVRPSQSCVLNPAVFPR